MKISSGALADLSADEVLVGGNFDSDKVSSYEDFSEHARDMCP